MPETTTTKYSLAIAGNPFIDALISNGIVNPQCMEASITIKAGHPIKVTQTVLLAEEQLTAKNTLESTRTGFSREP